MLHCKRGELRPVVEPKHELAIDGGGVVQLCSKIPKRISKQVLKESKDRPYEDVSPQFPAL
jgi:hypothetical protein